MQLFEIIAAAAIVLAVAAGTGLALVYRRLQRYQRSQHVIMGSRGTVDIVEHVVTLDEKLANVRIALEDLTLAVRDHDVRIDSSLSRVGIVRFDAYYDLGGRQSTAIALLNSLGDGVVVTNVVSRDFARIYVKLVRDGEPDIPLAPEEAEAVSQARGSTPFTIRPRVGGDTEEEGTPDSDEDAFESGGSMAIGLPGLRANDERELDRENRRRRREGLPPVDGKVVPSARGWDEPETPSSSSLAERFIQQRRQSLTGSDELDETMEDLMDDLREDHEL